MKHNPAQDAYFQTLEIARQLANAFPHAKQDKRRKPKIQLSVNSLNTDELASRLILLIKAEKNARYFANPPRQDISGCEVHEVIKGAPIPIRLIRQFDVLLGEMRYRADVWVA
jgi:hypothetical protein